MKLLICGSRTIKDELYVFECIKNSDALWYCTPHEIVTGGAVGVDIIAERFAELNKIPIKRFNAKWKELGKKAGILRDREMVEYADYTLAIWDGTSRGTKYTIEYTEIMKKPLEVIIKK